MLQSDAKSSMKSMGASVPSQEFEELPNDPLSIGTVSKGAASRQKKHCNKAKGKAAL